MIVGDTGTGKGFVFLEEFERQYLKRNPGAKIRRVNVAAIPATLIESELFGHEKGAFTTAVNKKRGLVEGHDALILEEIGVLPQSVQAKLLTFIEDKKYITVGGTEEKKAHGLQIVATTNMKTIATTSMEEGFRLDFWSRFFKFYVPPLYKHRMDVLFYFAHFAPDTFRELRPWEAMTLLCYHWPGNVRELKTIAVEIEIQKRKRPEGPLVPWHSQFHETIIGTQTGLSWDACPRFRNSLRMNGIDVDFLEKVLNKYGLGFDISSKKEPFKNGDIENLTALALIGFDHVFADLFFKNGSANKNLLSDRTDYQIPIGTLHGIGGPRVNKKKMYRLVADCLQYIGVNAKGKLPDVNTGYDFVRLLGAKEKDPIPAQEKNADNANINQSEEDFMRAHYRKMLASARGNVSEAARNAKLSTSTLRKRLVKYGLI